jgi:hypothetical protein
MGMGFGGWYLAGDRLLFDPPVSPFKDRADA